MSAISRMLIFWLAPAFLWAGRPANAGIITLDFEGIVDGTPIASIYSAFGATFTNATAATAGVSLNDAEVPPRSGENVALDDGGPIAISFASPVGSFFAYFTYASQLHLAAFDAGNTLVAGATSAFAENFVSSGNSPNELLQVIYGTGISRVVITGDPAGGSFAMDDATFDTTTQNGVVPEPATTTLVGVGLLAVIGRRLSRAVRARETRSGPRWGV